MKRVFRRAPFIIVVLGLSAAVFFGGAQIEPAVSSTDCTFLNDPSEFQYSRERHWRDVTDRTNTVGRGLQPMVSRSALNSVSAAPMPRQNFIDEHIFGRMERDGI